MPQSETWIRPKPVFGMANESIADESREISLHEHFDYELILAVKGKYNCELNSQPVLLTPGQAILIKPGDRHIDTLINPPLRYQTLSFYIESEDSNKAVPLFADGVKPSDQIIRMNKTLIVGTFKRIISEVKNGDEFSGKICQALTEELFWQVVRHFPAGILQHGFVSEIPE
ncbi:MAG: cupin domain-containing protein, partial [Planctomycetota bacterium]